MSRAETSDAQAVAARALVEETRRKQRLVCEWIEQEGEARMLSGTYGVATIQLVWAAGHLKEVRIHPEYILRDPEAIARFLKKIVALDAASLTRQPSEE